MNRRARRNKEFQDKQTRAIIVVCIVLILLQNYLSPPPPPVAPIPTSETEVAAQSAPRGPNTLADLSVEKIIERVRREGQPQLSPTPTVAALKVSTERLGELGDERALQRVEIMRDGQLGAWSLHEAQYRLRGEDGVILGPLPLATGLATQVAIEEADDRPLFLPPHLTLEVNERPSRGDFRLVSSESRSLELSRESAEGLSITKRYSLVSEEHRVEVEVEVANNGPGAVSLRWQSLLRGAQDPSVSQGGMFSMPTKLLESVCQRSEDLERRGHDAIVSDSADPDEQVAFSDGISWGSVDTRYFMSGLSASTSREDGSTAPLLTRCSQESGPALAGAPLPTEWIAVGTRLSSENMLLHSGRSQRYRFSFFLGPKKLDLLEAQRPSLASAIDFGWLSPVCLPMLWSLRSFFDFLPNWGIAIILLTLLVKLLTFPLTVKQYRSMAKMKIVQPQMKELQERFKDDPQRLQSETLQLYRTHGVNPLSGCLPMFLMMPIYFALYRTIFSAVELYQADFALWIHDLSKPDPYFITPLVLGALFVLQMRLGSTATSGNPEMQKMMTTVMPVMMTGMMLFLPSGLVIYIIVNTILGIFQQQWTQKLNASAA
ncbi:MAG: membrane protein insertase YidC [Myxococcota bacterium]|nr:membrane protein insertase YidC [Myxococcota bacterium]